jgi:hypothetical protein
MQRPSDCLPIEHRVEMKFAPRAMSRCGWIRGNEIAPADGVVLTQHSPSCREPTLDVGVRKSPG